MHSEKKDHCIFWRKSTNRGSCYFDGSLRVFLLRLAPGFDKFWAELICCKSLNYYLFHARRPSRLWRWNKALCCVIWTLLLQKKKKRRMGEGTGFQERNARKSLFSLSHRDTKKCTFPFLKKLSSPFRYAIWGDTIKESFGKWLRKKSFSFGHLVTDGIWEHCVLLLWQILAPNFRVHSPTQKLYFFISRFKRGIRAS